MDPCDRSDTEYQNDFVLQRKPSDFRRPFLAGHLVSVDFGCCCCCCCWDIVGAYTGAYVGGTIGSAIGYRHLRKEDPKLWKYRWLLLLSVLATATIVGLIFLALYFDWLSGDSLAISVVAVLLGVWVFGANPALCFLAARKFSWRLLGISFLLSLVGMVIGFAVGCAVMGGSIVLPGLFGTP